MWFGIAVIVIAIVAAVAGAFAGGIFTIVLIPLAVLALAGLFIAWLWGRSANAAGSGTTTKTRESGAAMAASLPHSRGGGGAHVPTSPDRLADARREQQ